MEVYGNSMYVCIWRFWTLIMFIISFLEYLDLLNFLKLNAVSEL